MARGRRRKIREGVDQPDNQKMCARCEQMFPMTQENFYVALRYNGNYTFSAYCISCAREKARDYTISGVERLRSAGLIDDE